MFLDIGLGIFGAITFSNLTGQDLSSGLIIISILGALLPDIDGLIFMLRGKKMDENAHLHRTLLHYPLVFLPLTFLITLGLLGAEFAILITTLTFLHFVHDSVDIGWGIKWGFPFSKKTWVFLEKLEPGTKRTFLKGRTDKELAEAVVRYADPDWFRKIYLRPHPVSIIELGGFLAAVITLVMSL